MNADALMQILPELVLLVGACAVLMVGVGRGGRDESPVPLTALITMLVALLISIGLGDPDGRAAPPGLALTAMTYYVRIIALSIGLLLILLNWRQAVVGERGECMAMVLFSLLGVLLVASADDLIVLFFAIELVSVPTYVLIALSRRDARASESAVKYFFLGAVAAALLAYGFSFLYGAFGTTTLSRFATGGAAPALAGNTLALIGFLLAFAGLSFKIAAVPFHAYAADVYEGAASTVTALLAFVPKLAGFVALIKVFAVFGWDLPAGVMWVVWIVAAVTMTVGNVLALVQQNIKRLLAYSSISHSGYMLIALLVGPGVGAGPMNNGVVALMFYIAVYGLMTLGAFAALAAFQNGDDSIETFDELSGLAVRAPIAAAALAVCVFSLMGFPPTAGFLGKVYIFSGAFSMPADQAFHGPLVALAVIGVVNSAIGAAYYLRIVATSYMNRPHEGVTPVAHGGSIRFGLTVAGLAMLVLFIWPAVLAGPARTTGRPMAALTGRPTATLTDAVAQADDAATAQPPNIEPGQPIDAASGHATDATGVAVAGDSQAEVVAPRPVSNDSASRSHVP